MNAWTSAAKDELNRFLASLRKPLEYAGADAAEVIEDIRRHIDEEIVASRLSVVTVTALKPMLARIGEPWQGATVVSRDQANAGALLQALKAGSAPGNEVEDEARLTEKPAANPAKVEKGQTTPEGDSTKFKDRPGFILLICGVILPALTLGIEWLTGFCAQNIFNPIPTWGHVLLIAMVPVMNLVAWRTLRRGIEERHASRLTLGIGFAIGVGTIYSVIFIPLVFPGLVAMMFFGLGLLPLAPYFAAGSSFALRKSLKKSFDHRPGVAPQLRFWPGVVLGVMAFFLVDFPHIATTAAMHLSANPAKEETGLRWLRTIGHRETILRACYPTVRFARGDLNGRGIGTALFWMLPNNFQVTTDQARKIYFQLYGTPFNAEPAPRPRTAGLTGNELEPFDPERGGEKVGSPVAGLSMQSSRIDATVEPRAALAYLEWITEFRNVAAAQSEARCEIAMPPGAVVSRLTLWINGEEREAAFAGKGAVRGAYQGVVAQRRDPVLVTTSGRDRILMQCFPVMPNGGVMKVRVGMTVPLQLDSEKNGVLRWPYITERNFALEEGLEHSFWIDSPVPVEAFGIPLKSERTASGHHMARGTLNEVSLPGVQPAVLVRREGLGDTAWAMDSRRNDGSRVEQTIRAVRGKAVSDIVVVLDGSASMERIRSELSELKRSGDQRLRIVVAGAEVREFTYDGTAAARRELESLTFKGGVNNLPALERAWDLAAERGSGAVLWIHGPQPVLLSTAEGLRQRFERRPNAVRMLDLPVTFGPNVIADAIRFAARYELVSMHRKPIELANGLIREMAGAADRFVAIRIKKQGEAEPGGEGAESNLHLVRLGAFEEIQSLIAAGRREEAVKLATFYQLVTEVSGAVVLETAEQYAAAGLQPVSPHLVPSVPEPGTWAILLIGCLLLAGSRRRALRSAQPGRT